MARQARSMPGSTRHNEFGNAFHTWKLFKHLLNECRPGTVFVLVGTAIPLESLVNPLEESAHRDKSLLITSQYQSITGENDHAVQKSDTPSHLCNKV